MVATRAAAAAKDTPRSPKAATPRSKSPKRAASSGKKNPKSPTRKQPSSPESSQGQPSATTTRRMTRLSTSHASQSESRSKRNQAEDAFPSADSESSSSSESPDPQERNRSSRRLRASMSPPKRRSARLSNNQSTNTPAAKPRPSATTPKRRAATPKRKRPKSISAKARSNRIASRKKLRRYTIHYRPQTGDKRHVVRWTQDESDAIMKGLQRYQSEYNKWVLIKQDPEFAELFAERTTVDIKDRFRTMSRQRNATSKESSTSARPRTKRRRRKKATRKSMPLLAFDTWDERKPKSYREEASEPGISDDDEFFMHTQRRITSSTEEEYDTEDSDRTVLRDDDATLKVSLFGGENGFFKRISYVFPMGESLEYIFLFGLQALFGKEADPQNYDMLLNNESVFHKGKLLSDLSVDEEILLFIAER